jgi:repressor LexA
MEISVSAVELPVMGRIAAGVPIEAISEVSHHIAVPGSMLAVRIAITRLRSKAIP